MPKKKKKKLVSVAERSNRSSQRVTSEDVKKARETVSRRSDSRKVMNSNIARGVIKRDIERRKKKDFEDGTTDRYTDADGKKWTRSKGGSTASSRKLTAAQREEARKRAAAKKLDKEHGGRMTYMDYVAMEKKKKAAKKKKPKK